MALAVEGAVTTTFTGIAAKALAITTAGADRIILVYVHNEKNGSRQTVSSVVASGLTFARRKALPFNSSGTALQNYEVWWAYAAAQLTAHNITVTLDAATDDATIIAFAVSGVDPSAFSDPFDPNASLPAVNTNPTSSFIAATVDDVSTTKTNTLLIIAWGEGISNAGNTPVKPADFTSLANATNTGGTNVSKQVLAYKILSAPLVAETVGFDIGTKEWGLIVDAINGDAAAPPSPLELDASFVDGAVMAAALTLGAPPVAPLELSASFIDGATMAATPTIEAPVTPLELSASFIDGATMGATPTIDEPAAEGTTWNPDDKSASVILSEGNTRYEGDGVTSGGVRSTTSKNAGKWYFEYQDIVNLNQESTPIGGGIADALISLAQIANGGGIESGGWINQLAIDEVLTLWQFAIDLDNGKLWYRKNNTGDWLGDDDTDDPFANPETGMGIENFIAGWVSGVNEIFIAGGVGESTDGMKLATRGADFAGTIPDGFEAWDAGGGPAALNLTASFNDGAVMGAVMTLEQPAPPIQSIVVVISR